MSAVVEAVTGAFEGVVDAVGDVISSVGKTVGNFVENLANDPLSAVATVVAVLNPEFAPLIMGANSAAHGGDIGDIALSAATAWAGGEIGKAVQANGFGATSEFTGSGISQGATSGLSSSATTGLQIGQNLGAGVGQNLGGLTSAGIGSSLASDMFNVNKMLNSATTSGAQGALNQLASTGKIDFGKLAQTAATGGVGSALNDLTNSFGGFSELNPAVKKALMSGAMGAITGQDPVQAATMGGLQSLVNTGIASAGDYLKSSLANNQTSYNTLADKYNSSAQTQAELAKQSQSQYTDLQNLAKQYDAGSISKDQWDAAVANYDKTNAQLKSAVDATTGLSKELGLAKTDYLNSALTYSNPYYNESAFLGANADKLSKLSPEMSAAEKYFQLIGEGTSPVATYADWLAGADSVDALGNINKTYTASTGKSMVDSPLAELEKTQAIKAALGSSPLASDPSKGFNLGWFKDYSPKAGVSPYSQLTPSSGLSAGNSLAGVTGIARPTSKLGNYGFGSLNAMLSDLVKTTPAANSFSREKTVYDPTALQNRLSQISILDSNKLGSSADSIAKYAGSRVGDRVFMPTSAFNPLASAYSQLGLGNVNDALVSGNAWDAFKAGQLGGTLNSYSNKSFLNPTGASSGQFAQSGLTGIKPLSGVAPLSYQSKFA